MELVEVLEGAVALLITLEAVKQLFKTRQVVLVLLDKVIMVVQRFKAMVKILNLRMEVPRQTVEVMVVLEAVVKVAPALIIQMVVTEQLEVLEVLAQSQVPQ